MQNNETRAIVLNTFNIKEKNKIIKVFSKNFGKMDLIYKDNKLGSLNNASQLDIFSEAFLNVYISKEYAYLIDYELISTRYKLRKNSLKILYGNVIIELLEKIFPMYFIEDKIYDLTLKVLDNLENKDNNGYLLVLAYILKFLAYTGYKLDFSKCANCSDSKSKKYYFSSQEGVLFCNNCTKGYNMYELDYSQITLVNKLLYSKIDFIPDVEYEDNLYLLTILIDSIKKIFEINKFNSLSFINLYKKGLYGQ
ncbi:DNA repair protein RecO [Miniphocaeibacter halophilus]|uniref:DNA repair protein RecO n=1 Tax=Miniphocaeibacter halophilus TaxID=2931922 RepID=A0AC61MQ05_9FIRM|nr:DNA repair protein RecO [Miniphocaeibacter halophilus]QQK07671.1 DNA repair protein RecO [Miniphocaeibacter halophilus]